MRTISLALSLLFHLSVTAAAGIGSESGFLDPEIQEALKYRKTRSIGGIYVGRFRPFYVDNDLYLQPIEPRISNRASCAARNLLRLDGERGSPEFRNKFDILLKSWVADREVVLIGKGTCSVQGDEIIFGVIPK